MGYTIHHSFPTRKEEEEMINGIQKPNGVEIEIRKHKKNIFV